MEEEEEEGTSYVMVGGTRYSVSKDVVSDPEPETDDRFAWGISDPAGISENYSEEEDEEDEEEDELAPDFRSSAFNDIYERERNSDSDEVIVKEEEEGEEVPVRRKRSRVCFKKEDEEEEDEEEEIASSKRQRSRNIRRERRRERLAWQYEEEEKEKDDKGKSKATESNDSQEEDEEEDDDEDDDEEEDEEAYRQYHYDYVAVTSRDCQWMDENNEDDDEDAQKRRWKKRLPPWTRQLESLLKEGENPDPPSCWGCLFEDLTTATIYSYYWNKLLTMFKHGLLTTGKIVALAGQMYKYFCSKVVVEMTRGCKKTKDIWSAYGIIRHFLYHNPDPEIRIFVNLWQTRSLVDIVHDYELVEEHEISGRLRISEDALKKYERLIKLEMSIAKSDPNKMVFRNKNRKLPEGGYSAITVARPLAAELPKSYNYRDFHN